MAIDAIPFSYSDYPSTVRLVFVSCLITVCLLKVWLTIWTRPLMGCTYSRLGATLGSPKLRLLSLLSKSYPTFALFLCVFPVGQEVASRLALLPLRVAVCRASSQLQRDPTFLRTIPLRVSQNPRARPLLPTKRFRDHRLLDTQSRP